MPLPRVAYVSSGAARPPAASNGYDPTQAAKLTRNMRGDPTKGDMGSLLFPEQPNQVSRMPVPASNVALHGTSVDHPRARSCPALCCGGVGLAPLGRSLSAAQVRKMLAPPEPPITREQAAIASKVLHKAWTAGTRSGRHSSRRRRRTASSRRSTRSLSRTAPRRCRTSRASRSPHRTPPPGAPLSFADIFEKVADRKSVV